jgi:hypothetical protein
MFRAVPFWALYFYFSVVVNAEEVLFRANVAKRRNFPEQKHAEVLEPDVYGSNRMLLMRPFSPYDYEFLMSGFDVWTTQIPCGINTRPAVDILLYFSRSWELWPNAKAQALEVVNNFENGLLAWSHCFGRIIVDTADMSVEEDKYDKSLRSTDALWVNGPNRQFERGVKWAQRRNYHTLYLMEPDSVPIKPYWLNSLEDEIRKYHPFSVLGSTFRGDKWHPFFSSLPLALTEHLNGNTARTYWIIQSSFLLVYFRQRHLQPH